MKRQVVLSLAAGILAAGMLLAGADRVQAGDPTMDQYTALPPFLDTSVPPNILFLVDFGEATLPAAYGEYPISFRRGTETTGTATFVKYAANVNVIETNPLGLVASSMNVNNGNTVQAEYTVDNPKDVFVPGTEYFGVFDPRRCYSYSTGVGFFLYAETKTAFSNTCTVDGSGDSQYWDGNFLNWLTTRKKDLLYQIIVGGAFEPPEANDDGSYRYISGEKKTGIEGSGQFCKYHGDGDAEGLGDDDGDVGDLNGDGVIDILDLNAANNTHKHSCFRYVKYVPADGTGTFKGRVPTTGAAALPADVAGNDPTYIGTRPGRFFGVGEGKLFVNKDASPRPFDPSAPLIYDIRVDLESEPNVPAGTGLYTDSCDPTALDYAGQRVCYVRERSTGLFQNLREDNMRIAVMFVHDAKKNGGKLIYTYDDKKLDKKNAIKKVRDKKSQEQAGLSEALYEALCYFHKYEGPCYFDAKAHYNSDVAKPGDPYYFKDEDQMVPCCQSFVLMLSPGKAVEDGALPDIFPFGNPWTNCGTIGSNLPADQGGCLDDVAYLGKTMDMRPDGVASPAGLATNQGVTFYAVSPMGEASGAQLLASAAKYGGFKDLNADGLPDAAGQACTYPAGSLLGAGAGVSSPEWDADKNCVPDTYFEANTATQIEQTIRDAINHMIRQAASGTAVSVLASSSTGEGAVFQSYFKPSTVEGNREVKWTGFIRGLFVDAFGNVREDTNQDGKLTYEDDRILESELNQVTKEVDVFLFEDADGNGLKDSLVPVATVKLEDVKAVWEAGKRLAKTAPASRNIKTWIDKDGDGIIDAGELISFEAANAAALAPFLRAQKENKPVDLAKAQNIINFVRGTQVAGMRDRRLTVDGSLEVWKLGDSIYSQPTMVGAPGQRYDVIYGDSTYTAFFQKYKNRRQVLYVGANDGMLHAFDGGFFHRADDPSTNGVTEHGYFTENPAGNTNTPPILGNELFGFIPQEALPHLEWLTRSDYTHVYYVDLRPKVTDVRIFANDADHPNGWGTILIGGMRLGGSCRECENNTGGKEMKWKAKYDGSNEQDRKFYSAYFVLDITNPESPDYGKLLWSFAHKDLGFSTSVPSMLRVSPAADGTTVATNEKWYLVIGSGATAYDMFAKQKGLVFAVDLKTGPESGNSINWDLATVKEVKFDKAIVGDTLTIDRDFDYRVDSTYFGIGKEDKDPYKGALLRWAIRPCTAPCSPAQWGEKDGFPSILLDKIAATDQMPIYSRPSASVDDANKLWVFAGTGRFFSKGDQADTTTRHFVGVKDPVLNSTCNESAGNNTTCRVSDANLVNVSSAQICMVGTGDCGGTVDEVSGVAGVTTMPGLVQLIQGKAGWYTAMPGTGERILSRPLVIGGIVFFTSFIPPANVCETQGDSKLYALHYQTGGPPASPVIGTTSSGGEEYINRSIDLGRGMASEVAVHRGSGSSVGKATAYVQIDDSTIVGTTVGGLGALASRFISWHYSSR